MVKYQYQVLRYMHDQITGEFVNVGIVLFDPESLDLQAKVISKFSRISNFFEEIDGHFFLNTLKHFQHEINYNLNYYIPGYGRFMAEKPVDLGEITEKVLLKDDNSLYLTEVKFGLDIDFEVALSSLFDRLIDMYNQEVNKDANSDQQTWTKVYKTYFDKYGITRKLKDHTVKTQNDSIKFDKAWKNGVWNCYQSVSFDLKRDDSIKSKVYKWSGIIKGLESANEKMNLYFLTASAKHNPHLNKFIKDTLSQEAEGLNVTIITEEQADEFASEVKLALENAGH